MSQPRYPRPITIAQAISLLHAACKGPRHILWTDDVSLLNASVADRNRIYGPSQLTDRYLLSLAVKHGGRLVTFDETIPLSAMRGARAEHVRVV